MKEQAHRPRTNRPTDTHRSPLRYLPGLRRLWFLCLPLLLLLSLPASAQSTTRGTFVIAVAADAPPFAIQAANGQLIGFDLDLIKMLVHTAGLRVVYEAAPFPQLMPGVATRLYDGALGCITMTEEHKALVDFSAPYFTRGGVFAFAAADAPIYDLTDLTPTMTVSVVAESPEWRFLSEQQIAVQVVASAEEAFALAAARITVAAFVDEVITERYRHAHPEAGLRVVSGLVTTEQCGIAVNKEIPQLLLELNAAMNRLKNSGKYLLIYQRWFGNRPLTGPLPMRRPVANTPTPTATPTVDLQESAPITSSVTP